MISLLDKFPEIAKEWDYEKNNGKSPADFPYGSHEVVFWKCPICNQSYPKKICNRTSPSKRKTESDKCPVCLGRYIIPHYNSLAVLFPAVAKEWDYEKNQLTPDKVAPHSNKKYWWKCKNGHSYEAKVNNKVNNNGGNCPYCSHQKLTEENSLFVVNPELSKEWDYEYNGCLTPKNVFANSNKKVGWICSKCGFKWTAKINNRNNGRGCPMCSKGAHSSFPEQVIYYYAKEYFHDAINGFKIDNNEIDVYIPSLKVGIEYDGEFFHKSKSKLNNDLRKNRFFMSRGIKLIRIRESGCPHIDDGSCEVYIIKYTPDYKFLENVLKTILTNLCHDAGIKRDICIDISRIRDIILSSIYTVKYEDSFEAYQNTQKNSGIQLKAIWDYEKNGKLLPNMVAPFSEKQVYWKCPNDSSHTWRNTVKSVSLGYGCPICSERHRYSTDEWIKKAKEIHGNKFDYSKSVYVKSDAPITIICPIHGEFLQLPYEHLSGKGCKYCANQAFHPLNCLANLYPDIAKQWDFQKNKDTGITPETIGINSTIKFWWHCTNGKSHSFQATIAKRVSGMQCAVCHGKQISYDTSLEVLRPDLCLEWSNKNELPPSMYSKGSEKKVWWICSEHKHPDYLASIYNRVHLGYGCPLCGKEKSRKKKR